MHYGVWLMFVSGTPAQAWPWVWRELRGPKFSLSPFHPEEYWSLLSSISRGGSTSPSPALIMWPSWVGFLEVRPTLHLSGTTKCQREAQMQALRTCSYRGAPCLGLSLTTSHSELIRTSLLGFLTLLLLLQVLYIRKKRR